MRKHTDSYCAALIKRHGYCTDLECMCLCHDSKEES